MIVPSGHFVPQFVVNIGRVEYILSKGDGFGGVVHFFVKYIDKTLFKEIIYAHYKKNDYNYR